MPRINNTIHRKAFVCRRQKSSSNRCKIHYHTIPDAPICRVLPHVAHTENNAITTFYINIHFNRSQNVVHALRKDAICCVLLRYALLCIFGGQFAVAQEKDTNTHILPTFTYKIATFCIVLRNLAFRSLAPTFTHFSRMRQNEANQCKQS